MSPLCSPGGILQILLYLSLVLAAGPPALSQSQGASDPNSKPAPALPAWTWVENCHVQRGHRLTDFGTFGSLLVEADNQTIVSQPFAGKNRTGASFLGTIKQDLWPGGALIAYAEGGTSYTLDRIIQDSLGTNGVAQQANLYLSHLFLLQDLADQHVQMALGRILMSDFFDTNRIANCEFTEFLSSCLVNDPTIPFPDAGMGAVVRLAAVPWLHLQVGVADASAHATHSDLDTAFRSFSNAFGIAGFALSPFSGPRAGVYRFLFWYDPSSEGSGDNHGFAVSFDQPATDRLSFFLRYGYADSPVNALTDFVSFGTLLQKPLPGRDHDSLLGAVAWGNATVRDETLVEVDYSVYVTESLTFTPLVQIISDPVQNSQDDTFVLAGIRAVYVF